MKLSVLSRLWAGKLRDTVQLLVGTSDFSAPEHPDQLWGPSSLIVNVYWGLSSQQPEHEAYGPPFSRNAKVKSERSYTFTLPYAFMGCTRTALSLLRSLLLMEENNFFYTYMDGTLF